MLGAPRENDDVVDALCVLRGTAGVGLGSVSSVGVSPRNCASCMSVLLRCAAGGWCQSQHPLFQRLCPAALTL